MWQTRGPVYDIAIVGAGPAGTTLARLLAPKHRVLLLERRPEQPADDARRRKACGGLLNTDALAAFTRLGLTIPPSIRVDPQPVAVCALDLDAGLRRRYRREYLNLDREALDRYLVSRIGPGVALHWNTRLQDFHEVTDGVELGWTDGVSVHRSFARVLIGADGASSLVRRSSFPRPAAASRYMAVQGSVPRSSLLLPDSCRNDYASLFARDVTDFYGWIIPKRNRAVIGVAIPTAGRRGGPKRGFRRLLQYLLDAGLLEPDAAGEVQDLEAAQLLRPRAQDVVTGNAVIGLVGEAAGFISPSSAEGFSWAIASAVAAARALAPGVPGWSERYSRLCGPLVRKLSRKRIKSVALYRPGIRRAVLASGLASLGHASARMTVN